MKYELTKKSIINNRGIKLFQIKAIISFGSVIKGELGGYIELEKNLAQVSGDAWVSGNAQVFGDARVFGDAWVFGNAWVFGDAWVSGNAQVFGNARVFGDIKLFMGFFFGIKSKVEKLTFIDLGDKQLIAKGKVKIEISKVP